MPLNITLETDNTQNIAIHDIQLATQLSSYSTTQMQLHTSARVLVCPHARVTRGAAHTHVLLEWIQTCYSHVHVTCVYDCMCNTFTFYKTLIMYIP